MLGGQFSGGRVASLRLEGGGASAAKMTQAEKGDTENGKEKGGEKEKEQRGVKRPIVPALVPESLQEVRRRGRASDSASGRGGGPRSWARGRRLANGGSLRAPTQVGGARGSFPAFS